jgi:hypothetical protein
VALAAEHAVAADQLGVLHGDLAGPLRDVDDDHDDAEEQGDEDERGQRRRCRDHRHHALRQARDDAHDQQ